MAALRSVTPAELEALAALALECPDLTRLPAELARLRALEAAASAAPELRPATVKELLALFDRRLIGRSEARQWLGLPPGLRIQERLRRAWRWLLQVVVWRLEPAPRRSAAALPSGKSSWKSPG